MVGVDDGRATAAAGGRHNSWVGTTAGHSTPGLINLDNCNHGDGGGGVDVQDIVGEDNNSHMIIKTIIPCVIMYLLGHVLLLPGFLSYFHYQAQSATRHESEN